MAYTPPGDTRRKVYRFVRQRLVAGEPPTIREVQEAFGFRSVESARSHLEELAKQGLLIKTPGRARGYRLPDTYGEGYPPMLVPLLGHVQAGNLTEAIEDPEGYLAIHSRPGQDELFALQVRGESMTGAGILPDDVVIVRRQPSADVGQIVVALVEEEATVKTLRREGPRYVLQPENPDFSVIKPEPDELSILGKVIEVRRYLDGMPLVERDA